MCHTNSNQSVIAIGQPVAGDHRASTGSRRLQQSEAWQGQHPHVGPYADSAFPGCPLQHAWHLLHACTCLPQTWSHAAMGTSCHGKHHHAEVQVATSAFKLSITTWSRTTQIHTQSGLKGLKAATLTNKWSTPAGKPVLALYQAGTTNGTSF